MITRMDLDTASSDIIPIDQHNEYIGSHELDPFEIQLWHYQPGVKLRQQDENLKKKYKMMPTFQKESPLNYFTDNLIFEECQTKKLGLLLDEYLDSKQFKIVNKELKVDGEATSSSTINNMTLKELTRLHLQAQDGRLKTVVDLDAQLMTEQEQKDEAKAIKAAASA